MIVVDELAVGGDHIGLALAADAATAGAFHKGMAVFTIAKGGLMYVASINGQKFKIERTGK